jgi:hypothetical protein
MKKVFLVLFPLLLLLGACGKEKYDNSSKEPSGIEEPVKDRLNSYLVEADGVTYRCFDMGYHGGLWCTVKPKPERSN